jgi:hypothetical protein
MARETGGHSPGTASFRGTELADMQAKLRNYARALAAMAAVEDLTALEDTTS